MFGKIVSFIFSLPKLLGWLREFMLAIGKAWQNYQREKNNEKAKQAAEKAKNEKNTKDLDDLFSGRK